MNMKFYVKEADEHLCNFAKIEFTAGQFHCMVLVYKTHSDVNHLLFQFLCDHDGKPVKRYAPSVQPLVSC